MDKSKKILIVVLVVLVLCLLGVRGCVHLVGNVMDKLLPALSIEYDHAECYTADTAGCCLDTITALEVEWINGDVEVRYDSIDCIRWHEIYLQGSPDEANMLHYYIHDHQLNLRYCASHYEDEGHWRHIKHVSKGNALHKKLVVILPYGTSFDCAHIACANGAQFITMDAHKMNISTINGDVTLSTQYAEHIDMSTINGTLTLYVPDSASIRVGIDKVNGEVHTDLPCQKEAHTYTYGQSPYWQVKMSVINGNMNILKINK